MNILSSSVKSPAIGFMVAVKFRRSSIFTVGGGSTLKVKSMVRVSNGFRFSKSNVSVLLFWEVIGSLAVRKLSFVSLNSRVVVPFSWVVPTL